MRSLKELCVPVHFSCIDLVAIGFFLHYRSLFRSSLFKVENIGVYMATTL